MLPERERGAALLTVLLLVAVIAVLASTALERVRLATRVAATAGAIGQARADALVGETVATVQLDRLLGSNPDRISLPAGRSDRPLSLPVPGGAATVALSDGGNCFNLNGLVTRTGPGVYSTVPGQVQAFARLMNLLGIPNGDSVAAAAADWIDSDQTTNPGGAEDERYTGYRTANTLMADPSELRAVAGVTPAIYAALRPWVCTLPAAEPATVNVDTLAPEQAPLLAAMAPSLPVQSVQSALLARPALGWAGAGEFWSALGQVGSTGDAASHTGVRTRWFALRVDVAIGDTRLEEHALIDARALPSRLVSRQWGEAS